MGIFSRRPATVVADAAWQPDGQVITCSSRGMNDASAAAGEAHGAAFTLASAPGATITIWCYAMFAPPDMDGYFRVGYRCDYARDILPVPGHEPWTYSKYDEDGEFLGTLEEADAAARETAELLATTRRDGPSEDDPQFFDWDGAPV
jgi:hypothetical protein